MLIYKVAINIMPNSEHDSFTRYFVSWGYGPVQGKKSIRKHLAHHVNFLFPYFRRSTYNHLSSWLTDARNLTNPNTVISRPLLMTA